MRKFVLLHRNLTEIRKKIYKGILLNNSTNMLSIISFSIQCKHSLLKRTINFWNFLKEITRTFLKLIHSNYS